MSNKNNNRDPKTVAKRLRNKGVKSDPTQKIENQIDSAFKRGEFDNLPGAGKPLKLDQNPFTKDTAIANDLLKNSGFSLPFVQEKDEILTAVSQAEKKLLRVWEPYDGTEKSRTRWQEAKKRFTQQITTINKRILTFNLKAPSVQLHIPSIRVDERIQLIQQSIK